MKKILFILALLFCLNAGAQSLVLLSTNDTHSNIDPDKNGVGGILQRKAIIDSIRSVDKNVILVDAGDVVQGSLYFKFFKGDVEYPLMNMMGYDVRILGNHEFDNGLSDLARYWKGVKGSRLSANYDFSDTEAKGLFEPYVIKKVGNKKVGFFGINVDPTSLISEENYVGMKYSDAVETANRMASLLKSKGCDLVVAVTHIGYKVKNGKPDDMRLASESKDIDIIIGGHSHTFVDPSKESNQYWVKNADGKEVLVTQTGKNGMNIGYIRLNLADFKEGNVEYRLIPVTDRFPQSRLDKKMREFLVPYKHLVDSVNARVIAHSLIDMPNGKNVGAYPNWAGDFGAWYGRYIADSLRNEGIEVAPVAFGLMNVGGIRQSMPAGDVTEGQILSTFPFSNKMRLIEISGADLLATMQIIAPKGGEAVSSEVRVVVDTDGKVKHFLIDGYEINPDKKYVVATIDYVANGNDDMTPMKNHREIWRDSRDVCYRILEYIYRLSDAGVPISSDETPRFIYLKDMQ